MLCYLVRHAESKLNAGSDPAPDGGLSPLGVRQADAMAERLSAARPAAIYASPYRRTIETALPLARRLGLPVRLRHELCEFHPAMTDLLRAFAPPGLTEIGALDALLQSDPDDRVRMAWPAVEEGREGVAARTRAFADEMRARWTGPQDVIVCVSHGTPIARMIDAWLSDAAGPSFRFIIENTALTALRYYEGVRSLIALNDTVHLAGLPRSVLSQFDADGLPRPVPTTPYF